MSAEVVACPECGRRNRIPAAARGGLRCPQGKAALPWLVDVGDADWQQVVTASPLPVLVDVWAPWCGPCRAVAPSVARLAEEFAGRLKVAKLNADEAPRTSAGLQVQGIPALVLLDGGREVSRVVGARPYEELRRWVTATQAVAP